MIRRANFTFRQVTAFVLSLILVLLYEPVVRADAPRLSAQATEAARLLNIQSQVEQLMGHKGITGSQLPSDQDLGLQVLLARRVLGGSLEVRRIADTIDDELATEYTVQGEMMAGGDRGLNLNNSANFLQGGSLGVIAGGLALNNTNTQANELNIVSGGLTLLLSSLALAQTRGGTRKANPDPNMLGQVFNLDPPSKYHFSSLIWAYLNSVPPDAKDGLTRKEHLIEHWKKAGVLTINVGKHNAPDKVAAFGPGHKRSCETIKLITNRIVMLHDVHTMVERLDSELVELLEAID